LKCAHAALCFQEENRCQEEKKRKQNWKIICTYSYIFFLRKSVYFTTYFKKYIRNRTLRTENKTYNKVVAKVCFEQR